MAVEYKCENCMASLRYDIKSEKLVCDYCGSAFDTDYMEEKMNPHASIENENFEDIEEVTTPKKTNKNKTVQDISSAENTTYSNSDTPLKIRVASRKCKSCGADILSDGQTMASFCAFCGNAELSDMVESETRIPDMIIPFKVPKEAAKKAFMEWGSKGFVTPKDFTSTSTVEKITGMYVPFFLFNVDVECDYQATAEKSYTKKFFGKEWEITEYWRVSRTIKNSYVRIPADASKEMDDSLMDRLEPFDYSDFKEYKQGYLSGFLADNYTVDDIHLADRIANRVKKYSLDAAESVIAGYDCLTNPTVKYTFEWDKAKYAMLPVWILNYKYNDKIYEFAMNGQTGRVVGNRPVSSARVALLAAIVFAIAYIASIIIGIWFTGPFIFLLGIIIAGIISFCVTRQKVSNQNTAMESGRMNYQAGETIILSKKDKYLRKTRHRIDK